MDQSEAQPSESQHLAREADAARAAQLQRDRDLSPAQRLDKLAAVCRQAELLRDARRMP
jgi:hypothetical protein